MQWNPTGRQQRNGRWRAPLHDERGCSSGEGGTDGSNAARCQQLDSDYASALAAAAACTPDAPNQCQELVAAVPTACPPLACGQQAYVNYGGKLEPILDEWAQFCDPGAPQECPSMACSPPLAPATCVPDGPGATTGSCVAGAVAGAVADGGTGPDGGNAALCQQLTEKYNATLSAAASCTPGSPNQCQAIASKVPANCAATLCDQQTYVNDGASVAAALQSWVSQGCGGPDTLCLLFRCDPPSPAAVCVPVGSAGTGDKTTAVGVCVSTSAADGGAVDAGAADAGQR